MALCHSPSSMHRIMRLLQAHTKYHKQRRRLHCLWPRSRERTTSTRTNWSLESNTSNRFRTSWEEECVDLSLASNQWTGQMGVHVTTWVTQASRLPISRTGFDGETAAETTCLGQPSNSEQRPGLEGRQPGNLCGGLQNSSEFLKCPRAVGPGQLKRPLPDRPISLGRCRKRDKGTTLKSPTITFSSTSASQKKNSLEKQLGDSKSISGSLSAWSPQTPEKKINPAKTSGQDNEKSPSHMAKL